MQVRRRFRTSSGTRAIPVWEIVDSEISGGSLESD